ncbi:MAG: glycerol dehydrogenase [Deltaproteobacteria bacterium]|nr:glycerol dehydrogenase [Deltaproteobacteria bacterium]
MAKVITRTRALGSPGKYIQGRGEIKSLGAYLSGLGKRPLILIDPFLYEDLRGVLLEQLKEDGFETAFLEFSGEISENEIKRVTTVAKQEKCNAVVGIGGGKTIDTGKAVANNIGSPVVVVPTAASTDAPCSALSVIYTDEGVYSKVIRFGRNPDLVLVDTDIVSKAPVRLLVSGMGDALATFFEARANQDSDSANYIGTGFRRSLSGMALSRLCYDILLAQGVKAKAAVERNACTDAVEDIIEANTLLSGLGFENCGCAAAHGIHDGLTALEETHHLYHGEKVAFGTVCQLVMENRPIEEINEVLSFCRSVGLPTMLKDLRLENASKEDLMKVAKKSIAEDSTIHAEPFEVSDKMVYDAMVTADSLAKIFADAA